MTKHEVYICQQTAKFVYVLQIRVMSPPHVRNMTHSRRASGCSKRRGNLGWGVSEKRRSVEDEEGVMKHQTHRGTFHPKKPKTRS